MIYKKRSTLAVILLKLFSCGKAGNILWIYFCITA